MFNSELPHHSLAIMGCKHSLSSGVSMQQAIGRMELKDPRTAYKINSCRKRTKVGLADAARVTRSHLLSAPSTSNTKRKCLFPASEREPCRTALLDHLLVGRFAMLQSPCGVFHHRPTRNAWCFHANVAI